MLATPWARPAQSTCHLLKEADVLIPAICENVKCRHVFFTQNLVGGNATVAISDCFVGPCPRCGGVALIPAGRYSLTGGTIFDHGQWQAIATALVAIRDEILAGASAHDISKKIESSGTLSKRLAKFIPKDLKDLETLLRVIAMLIAAHAWLTSTADRGHQVLLPEPAIQILTDPDQSTEPAGPQPNTDTPQQATDAATETSPRSDTSR
jgi:hypothetical protein